MTEKTTKIEAVAGEHPMDAGGSGPPPPSPFCVHLRTKKSYFLRRPPAEASDLLDGSGHCWCLRTMLVLGPDGGPVEPEGCRAGRSCFESIL